MMISTCKQAACIVFAVFVLLACDYSPESLPKRLESDYELAIPIADTVLRFSDIDIPPFEIEVPAGTEIPISLSFPFYLADFTEDGKIIEWVEPKAIITDSFLNKADIFISAYIDSNNGDRYTLVSNKLLVGNNNVLFGDAESRISPSIFASLEGANQLNMVVNIQIKENIKLSELLKLETHVKFGLKIRLIMGFDL